MFCVEVIENTHVRYYGWFEVNVREIRYGLGKVR